MIRVFPLRNEALRRGAVIALAFMMVDQISKQGLLHGLGLTHEPIAILPFLDFVLVWNRGVSYGLFAADSPATQWLLISFALIVTLIMAHYLSNQTHMRGIWAFALIIGGALGNVIDRVVYGAVVDFISLHAYGYYWYVFNLADVWISLGVGLYLLESLRDMRAQNTPD